MREEVGVHPTKQIRGTHEIGHLARDRSPTPKTKRAEGSRMPIDDAESGGRSGIRTGGVPLVYAIER
jgi:hypothetical protein